MSTKIRSAAIVLALAACAAAAATTASAQESSGVVKTSKGIVALDRSGQRQVLEAGFPVLAGDRIITGAEGYAGITLRDDTLLTVGPNSALVIDRFKFDPKTQSGAYLVSMLKGVFAVVSGVIARRAPDAVSFRTPTSTIGIRGTEFIVELQGDD